MRFVTAVFVFALVACSPPNGAPPDPRPPAASSGVSSIEASTMAIDPQVLLGQWSFDRSCGVYDLVFNADNEALYFDYSDPSAVVSYAGQWSVAGNRIVLTVNKSGEEGSQLGPVTTYNFDVSAPVTDDLVGSFGMANGATHNINAKRCPQEDRE